MTKKEHKLFEDFSRLAGSTMETMAQTMADVKTYTEQTAKSYFEQHAKQWNMVTREEFEVVKKMAEKARSEQEKLIKKVSDLEQKLKSNK